MEMTTGYCKVQSEWQSIRLRNSKSGARHTISLLSDVARQDNMQFRQQKVICADAAEASRDLAQHMVPDRMNPERI